MNIANTESDFQIIAELSSIIWKEHYTDIIGSRQVDYMLKKYQSVEAIKDQIEEGALYYLITHQGSTVGYLSYYKKADCLFLSKIYILKEYRGKGIGKKTMHYLETTAEHLGYKTLSLTVNKNNIETIKAYEKMGFKQVRDIVIDIGNDFIMDDYIMEKEL
ncbi:GNAT family N-acetyltransferase [Ancylomarina euxinus]|uniref:GNAT family N-acetyltransferase n=2 Tax=Ancylomarina euxinus TaxID=2283627 RepID=A0A425Y2G5_9BACT|nr:GNAT family N-acetyltransferase [Ancylomarina euxinus]RRG22189.1 GNAT family N-acetyltransferase [Ancylomarina euxinus]